MLQVLSGTGCQVHCIAGGTITGCVSNDGCCPTGCNSINDNNCAPVCGNGVVESGELCDGNCPTAAPCVSDSNWIRTLSGTGCSIVCNATARPCILATTDGFCPSMCNSSNDFDCPPPNDKCPNAIDLAGQPSWTVNIPPSTQQDATEACGAKGPEVFYTFKLQASELIYLSVLDKPYAGKAVPVTLELYGACPGAAGGNAIACDSGAQGQGTCRGAPFPLITSSTSALSPANHRDRGRFSSRYALRKVRAPGPSRSITCRCNASRRASSFQPLS